MRKPPLQDVIVKQQRPSAGPAFQRPVRPEGAGNPFPPRRLSEPTPEPHRNDTYDPSGAAPLHTDQTPQFRGRRLGDEDRAHSRKWLLIALGIGVVVILCSIALSLLFAGATVTVYPKQDTVAVGATFTASKDTATGALSFERVSYKRTAYRSVPASGESQVEERTSGTITIYNEYSDTPQRLIKRTRFKSSDGKIYRIQNAVEVPGKKTDNTPGSISAEVIAEESGESYNFTGPMTFSVPGFDGTPQEGLVYAKSTDDFMGGFVGVKRTVAEADRTTALEQLEQQLRDELFAEAFSEANRSPDHYLPKGAVFYEFTTLPDELVEADQVTVSLSGTLHGVLFNTQSFAQRIARSTVASYNDEAVYLETPDDVTVRLEPVTDEASESVAPWEAPSYTVRVDGKAHFIWEFDEAKLAGDLAAKEKGIVDAPYEGGLLSSYTGIDRLQATIRPFWKQSFPDSAEDIVIIQKLDE